MKRMFNQLTELTESIDAAMARLQRRFRQSRPGSVLIMVVALLVLLALMGTAYLATARQDRIASGLILDNGIDAAAKHAAEDALASVRAWLGGDQQTFTTYAIGNPRAHATDVNPANGLVGPLVATRTPDLAPYVAPIGPFALPPALSPTGGSPTYVVRTKRVTVPPGYGRFASPLPSPGTAFTNNFSIDPRIFYDFNDSQDWAVPTSMTINYPKTYSGTQSLQGQTRTYPAFLKYTWDQGTNTALVSGPYIAADTTGGGIADGALVPLDLPSVNGVQWFVSWRILDNAAAINVNTAWGPTPYPNTAALPQTGPNAGRGNFDGVGNAFNFFPTDIDLYGFLNAGFNQTNTVGKSEIATLQSRRMVPDINTSPPNPDNGPYASVTQSDNVAHSDMAYLYRGESMWWHLGRRLDNPSLGIAGDYLDGFRRPFTDTDTIALQYHGTMCDPASAQSKLDQVFANVFPTGTATSDSIYRGAINYMINSQDRFSVLPANAVAYWYDWNFNFEGYTGNIAANQGMGLGGQTDSLNIAGRLGNNNASGPPPYTSVNNATQAAFRTARTQLVANSVVANITRAVDPTDPNNWPDITQKVNYTGPLPTGDLPPVPMKAITNYPQKVSLNTGNFDELWRAFANVFNDFSPEDGASPTGATNNLYKLYLHRDAYGYDSRDKMGANGSTPFANVTIDPTHAVADPMQFRNVLRDPALADSTSNGIQSAINSTSARAWLDARSVAALRAAIAAVNVITLRDQHGYMFDTTNNFFAPNVSKQITELNVQTNSGGGTHTQSLAYIYGGAPQPFITEVYVDNDTQDHAGKSNANGLVVVKLYNPYPYALPLANYDIAVVDRTGFSAPTAGMSVSLISRTVDPLIPANTVIPANGYLMLTNLDPTNGYWPNPGGAPVPTATNSIFLPGLSDVVANTTPAVPGSLPNKGGELLLLRPRAANFNKPNQSNVPYIASPNVPNPDLTVAEVPVDVFDFTNMKLDSTTTKCTAWHYLRMSGNSTNPAAPDLAGYTGTGATSVAWKCVYPGPYSGNGDFTNAQTNNPDHVTAPPPPPPAPPPPPRFVSAFLPHFQNTDTEEWDTAKSEKSAWDQNPATMGTATMNVSNASSPFHFDLTYSKESTYPNNFPGIQICNIDFGGFNKRDPNGTALSAFPYGGFARVGDVLQAPFIGTYVIFPTNDFSNVVWPPKTTNPKPVVITEANPVTIDSCYADDGDISDDNVEQVGRFVPIVTTAINDLSPSGYYRPVQDSNQKRLINVNGPWHDLPQSLWRYHFAGEVYNQFTVVSSPSEDYFPNINPDSWYTPASPSNSPTQVQGASSGVEGLININTADWRVLTAAEMIPRSKDTAPPGIQNLELAKAIVYFRDVDDGLPHFPTWMPDSATGGWTGSGTNYKRGHGAFNNLAELNAVYFGPPGTATPGFQNAAGQLNGLKFDSEAVRHQWGYYTPGGIAATSVATDNLQNDDWINGNLMVDRVSNLLTTRSDSFTVYVVVQGWRNAYTAATAGTNGPWPELVVQKRLAMTVDRSAITPTNKTLKTTLFPTK